MADTFDNDLRNYLDPDDECPQCGGTAKERYQGYCSAGCRDLDLE